MKRRLMKYFGLIIGILILFGFSTIPVSASSAELSIQTDQLTVGDSVQFTITLVNVNNASEPKISPIDGLEIQSLGQSFQSGFSSNSGFTSTVVFNYVVQPVKPGSYTLGPFEINAGGKKYTTNALRLTVANGGSGAGNQNQSNNVPSDSTESAQADSQLFFSFAVPKTKIYWGDQIPVTFRLYVGDVRPGGSIDSIGFEQSQLTLSKLKKTNEYQKTINGQTFNVIEITGLLTPVKTGVFTLGPAKMVLPVMVRKRNPFDDFFDNYVKRTVELKSKNSVNLTVLSLPDSGRPGNFSGGIGRFQLSASAGPQEVLQGDPVTIKMTVSGAGNFKSIGAPYLVTSKDFKVYDPQRKDPGVSNEENIDRVNFEQVVIPLDPKVKQVGPFAFSYFDPAAGSYRQAIAAAVPITVKSNPNFNAAAVMTNPGSGAGAGNEELGQDLIFIKENPGNFKLGAKPIYRELWFDLLQLLPVLGLFAAFIYRRKQVLLQADTPESRALRANNKASRRLATAAELKTAAKYEELLEELHLTIRQYLGEKFNLAAAGMTVKVVEVLHTKGVPAGTLEDIREFFERYDYHRFTGSQLAEADATEFWERAQRILSALDHRKKAPVKSKSETLVSRGELNGK